MLTNKLIKLYDAVFSPVYIVSYPKAGRTWLRALIAESLFPGALAGDQIDVTTKTRFSHSYPTLRFTHRGVKEVAYFDFKKFYGSKKILILVRDPRDIVISSYFEYTRRRDEFSEETTLSDFIRDPEFGIESVVSFYNELADSGAEITMIAKYEDLRGYTKSTFKNILSSLGVLAKMSESTVEQAINRTEFTKMQKLAKQSKDPRLTARDQTDPESQKVRKGKVGGYKDYMNEADCSIADAAVKKLSTIYGY